MKTAIYIEDGVIQLVLTPENEWEKNAVRAFENKPTKTEIKVGSFYGCQGGWTRHTEISYGAFSRDDTDRSIIMRIEADKTIPT